MYVISCLIICILFVWNKSFDKKSLIVCLFIPVSSDVANYLTVQLREWANVSSVAIVK